ncbi:MAG: 6-carboxytetrahydropterin synthase QueD [Dehalococcoidales bacterium]
MYEIAVESHFDAAHFLRGYQGKCEAVHGHRFQVVAKISASELDDTGMAYDFTQLKRHLNDILSRFDHTCLNEIPPFDKLNPSSENIATTIYQELKPKLSGTPVTISSIEVWESPQTWVTYRPD